MYFSNRKVNWGKNLKYSVVAVFDTLLGWLWLNILRQAQDKCGNFLFSSYFYKY